MITKNLLKINKSRIKKFLIKNKAIFGKFIESLKFNIHRRSNKKTFLSSSNCETEENLPFRELINPKFGKYDPKEFIMLSDSDKYKIIKYQLQLITKGEVKVNAGEVEYLKELLKNLRKK